MAFNPEDPKNQTILNYFKEKSCLIVDPQKNIRTTLKKILVDFGVPPHQIYIVEDFDYAIDLIKEKKPHYIFTSLRFKNDNKKSGLDLLPKHLDVHPFRLEAGFFLLLGSVSQKAACAVLEQEVDFFLSEPFTVDRVTDILLKRIEVKVNPIPYQRFIEKGKEYFFQNKLEEAQREFHEAASLIERPVQAFYYLGEIALSKGEKEKALDLFEEGQALSKESFKCSYALFRYHLKEENFSEAYKYSRILLEKYPLNPERLTTYIRLSLSEKKFDDLFQYAEIFQSLPDDERDEQTEKHLASALSLAGKYFMATNKKDNAADAYLASIKIGHGKVDLFKAACAPLLQLGEYKTLKKLADVYEETQSHDPQYQIIQLQVLAGSSNTAKALAMALDLIDKKIIEPEVFEVAIRVAKKLGKNATFIEDLVFKAKTNFPENEAQFQKIAQGSKN